MKTISFDVFDTLITREVAKPNGIFSVMQEKLLNDSIYKNMSEYVKENFYTIRINAEKHASIVRQKEAVKEYRFDEIYDVITASGMISKREKEQLKELEIQTEIENIIAIKENINKLKRYLKEEYQVICISDMYLSENIIRQLLVKVDKVFKDIPIYVSCDCGVNKHSGKLFKYLKQKLNLKYECWKHIGDNEVSDIKMPKSLGIKTELYKYTKLTDLENHLVKENINNPLIQKIIGISKNIRIKNDIILNNEKQELAFNVGSTLGGYVLLPYALWLIEQANNKNIKRLYFIARDGYIIKKIVDLIIDKRKLDIETYYIYGSRCAWQLPSMYEETIELTEVLKISLVKKIKNIEQLSKLLCIDINRLKKYIRIENENFDTKYLIYIINKLNKNEEFMELFRNNLKVLHYNAVEYLKQNIKIDQRFAFVEISGTGFTQSCLQKLICEFYKQDITTFYYGLCPSSSYKYCNNYFLYSKMGITRIIFEMLSRGMHGQTIYYKENNGIMDVVFGTSFEIEQLKNIAYDYYIKGVIEYTKEILNSNVIKGAKMLDLVMQSIECITTKKTKELEFIGDIPSGVDGREDKLILFAPILTKEDIKNIYYIRTNESLDCFYKASSLELSLLRTNEEKKILIDKYKSKYNSKEAEYERKKYYKNEKEVDIIGKLPNKIILYAAGVRGQKIYKKLKNNIVMWVDKNATYYQSIGLDVKKIETINNIEYNCIVVAVANFEVFLAIREELLKLINKKTDIYWIDNIEDSYDK